MTSTSHHDDYSRYWKACTPHYATCIIRVRVFQVLLLLEFWRGYQALFCEQGNMVKSGELCLFGYFWAKNKFTIGENCDKKNVVTLFYPACRSRTDRQVIKTGQPYACQKMCYNTVKPPATHGQVICCDQLLDLKSPELRCPRHGWVCTNEMGQNQESEGILEQLTSRLVHAAAGIQAWFLRSMVQ